MHDIRDAKVVYEDTIALDPYISIETVRAVRDKLRELGTANIAGDFDKIVFSLEANDLWDVHEYLFDIQITVESYGLSFSPDKEKVRYLRIQPI